MNFQAYQLTLYLPFPIWYWCGCLHGSSFMNGSWWKQRRMGPKVKQITLWTQSSKCRFVWPYKNWSRKEGLPSISSWTFFVLHKRLSRFNLCWSLCNSLTLLYCDGDRKSVVLPSCYWALDVNSKIIWYILHLSTYNFQDHSLVIILMLWLSLLCVRLLQNDQHRLKRLNILCKTKKVQLDIDGNPSFLDQFL